jgi:rubrerythrin
MKYIAPDKAKKLYDMAKGGDKSASDFLMGYMDMSDDEANAKLAQLTGEKGDGGLKSTVEFLIEDEEEAIDGYDKAIRLAQAQKQDGAVKVFEEIRKDEFDHVAKLQNLKEALKDGVGK